MAQCIIYARVSTRQQAWGHGIIRQIECCQQQAKSDKAWVRSVYVDVCSGTGPKPNRERAIAESKDTGCPVYIEGVDRWTRQADEASLNDYEGVDLVICGEAQQGLANVLRLLLP